MLWFRCAAVHDPVRPVVRQQAVIGWEARERKVDLEIEGRLKGGELLKKMKGWFTADVNRAVEIFEQHGRLKLLDDAELVVETDGMPAMEDLSDRLLAEFGQEVWIEHMPKKKLL